jgi:DNA polymerase III alpha subunit
MRIRTGYSFKKAIGNLDDVFKRLDDCDYPVFPICDYNSVFGFNRWQKKCKENKKQPAFGIEINVCEKLGQDKPVYSQWCFFAIRNISAISNLFSLASSNPDKQPCLTYDQAIKAKGVIKIAGNLTPEHIIKKYSLKKNFYTGLSPSTPLAVVNMWRKHNTLSIAMPDNVYANEKDKELYRLTFHKGANTQSYPQHILDKQEFIDSVKFLASKDYAINAIEIRNSALGKCKARMKKAKLLVPEKEKELIELCKEGAKKLGVNLRKKEYKERLNHEISLIHQKNFEDYFYIIADLVAYAKQTMVVGPARGSSGGSLVCFLLGITTIDPIKYGLIFERFIDINRDDLPDIDIDFSDKRRYLVFNYIEEKYGSSRVARLGTVGMYKAKSALREVGKTLDVPLWMIEKALESVIERASGDDRALDTLVDTLSDTENGKELLKKYPEIIIAGELEGHPRNASQHAAGIVLTDQPVNEIVTVDARTKAAMCDKKDAEDLDLLKIDALGLRQLSIFERAMDLIGVESISGWLEKIPLDDKKAFEVLNSQYYSGIFQFNGSAVQGLAKDIHFSHIEDLINITALARPGPLSTGGAHDWVKRKNGKQKVTYPHKLIEKYTKETNGIVVFQEQVMHIVKNIGNLSWEDTSEVRKGIGKTKGEEFLNQYKDKFVKGSVENGLDEKLAVKTWNDLVSFGAYAFNRSHSVAYAIVSYWCCWFKVHHPLEFAAATLDAQTEALDKMIMLRELEHEGISYLPFDIETSTDHWEISEKDGKKIIVGPLSSIKGIGPASMHEIMECRKNNEEIRPALRKRMEKGTTEIDTLYPIHDNFNRLHPDPVKSGIKSKVDLIKNIDTDIGREVLSIATIKKITPIDENEPERVEKRKAKWGGNGKYNGPTRALNLWMQDDTGEIFCKINRYKFAQLADVMLKNGKVGKSLFAVKGKVPNGFRMIDIDRVKFLGNIDD